MRVLLERPFRLGGAHAVSRLPVFQGPEQPVCPPRVQGGGRDQGACCHRGARIELVSPSWGTVSCVLLPLILTPSVVDGAVGLA